MQPPGRETIAKEERKIAYQVVKTRCLGLLRINGDDDIMPPFEVEFFKHARANLFSLWTT